MTAQAPTRIVRFGAGAIESLGEVCAEAGIARPLLVTTRTGAARAGDVSVVGRYSGVRSHVPVETVREARELARSLDADGLVGLGGGSAIDTCKAVVALLAGDGEEALPRVVAIPTTYAGAEWTPFFGMLLEPGRKSGGSDSRATPVAAVYDPELTLDLPREATVGTAMNALAHCAEAYYHPARTAAPSGTPTRGRRLSATRCRSSSRSRARSTGGRACSRAPTAPRSPSRSRASVSRTRWRRCSGAGTACRRVR